MPRSKAKRGERAKTNEEMAEETGTSLILCDHVNCDSYAKFEPNDIDLRFCTEHLVQYYKINRFTDKPEYPDQT